MFRTLNDYIKSKKNVKIFISHISIDEEYAKKIAEILDKHGLEYYLDKEDRLLDGEDFHGMPDHLREKINECNHIIVLVSDFTVKSWWVPWEIGIATEKGLRIATYILQNYSHYELPSFLKNWPILKKIEDIDTYADEAINMPLNIMEAGTENLNDLEKRRSSAHEFHQKLKERLNQ